MRSARRSVCERFARSSPARHSGTKRSPPSALGARRAKLSRTSSITERRTGASAGIRSAATARLGRPTPPAKRRSAFSARLSGATILRPQNRQTRKAATVAELCDAYLEAVEAGRILTRRKAAKKPSTIYTDKGRIERHIKPLLGRPQSVGSHTGGHRAIPRQCDRGRDEGRIKTGKRGLARVTGGQGTATRTMGLLGAIFSFAAKRKLRTDNPVRGVERHADGQRTRRWEIRNTPRSGKPCGPCPRRLGRLQ